MLSQEQLYRLMEENESQKVQLEELNAMLSLREEELELMKENAKAATELRSMLDLQLDELHTMQDHIGQKQQQVEGAVERELELEQELMDAARSQQRYNDLVQQYAHSQAQLSDIQEQLLELRTRNQLLQKIATKIGEVESHLANTVMERDALKARIASLEHSQDAP